ncbi:MAG: ATP-grasp domain-containing protein [Candidatus Dormibacteraceae bacterium]
MTRLYIVARNSTDSVTHGFLPAAAQLGLPVTLVTDAPEDHQSVYAALAHAPAEIISCQVNDAQALISCIKRYHRPLAIFSNSDHLQAETALAAAYFGLPGKGWQSALRSKNKALMRQTLADLRLDSVAFAEFSAGVDPTTLEVNHIPYPVVLKPRQGVASEDVFLARDQAELKAGIRAVQARGKWDDWLLEEYLPGQLYTLETVGDGKQTWVLGGFRTSLSKLPYFIEKQVEWETGLSQSIKAVVLDQLAALGVDFGSCHTEFVVAEGRPRLIEVNYRLIGDHCDFLLADLLEMPLFELILRLHLGESLPGQPPATQRWALVDYIIAEASGTLVSAPADLDLETAGVKLNYRSLCSIGDRIQITHSNRDYLGILRTIGPDQERCRAAVADFRSNQQWQIV